MAQFPANVDLSSLNGATGFKLSGAAARGQQRHLGRLGRRRQRRRLRRPDRRRPLRRSARRLFRRELCGVRQGFGLRRQHRSLVARRHQRLQAQRRGGGRPERLLGRLGRRRQRRRLRRPDRRRLVRRPARHLFRRELCGVRQGLGLRRQRSISRRSTARNGFKLSGAAAYDYSGISVAVAGDVNGDGFADLIVGAYGADPHGIDSGASYVVFGKASGFAANIDLSALDGSNGFRLSGAAAGDQQRQFGRRRPATSTATASPT